MGKENHYYVGRIISEPSAEGLRPTFKQIEEQRSLARSEKEALKTDLVVGEPCPLIF